MTIVDAMPTWSDVALRRCDGLPSRNVDAETIVYDQRTGTLYSLDPIAATIWDRLESTCLLTVLCAELASTFEVPVERVATDLDGPLQTMIAAGLVIADPRS